MAIRFSDRAAIVTGAAAGIGREIAVALADEGATVVACEVAEQPLRFVSRAGAAAHGRRRYRRSCHY